MSHNFTNPIEFKGQIIAICTYCGCNSSERELAREHCPRAPVQGMLWKLVFSPALCFPWFYVFSYSVFLFHILAGNMSHRAVAHFLSSPPSSYLFCGNFYFGLLWLSLCSCSGSIAGKSPPPVLLSCPAILFLWWLTCFLVVCIILWFRGGRNFSSLVRYFIAAFSTGLFFFLWHSGHYKLTANSTSASTEPFFPTGVFNETLEAFG